MRPTSSSHTGRTLNPQELKNPWTDREIRWDRDLGVKHTERAALIETPDVATWGLLALAPQAPGRMGYDSRKATRIDTSFVPVGGTGRV